MRRRAPWKASVTESVRSIQLVVEGKANAEIATTLSLSVKTVETYKSRLMNKLEIKDIPSLVKFALAHGLTTLK